MSFAVFRQAGKEPEVDFLCFARGHGIISEHATQEEANKALEDYVKERQDVKKEQQEELFG